MLRVRAAILSFFEGALTEEWLALPHARGDARAALFELSEVLEEHHDEEGGRYRVRGTEAALERVRALLATPI